ncbi:MAG: hypothetical protein WBE26_09680, partial [Phycisphaerae bacterium]
MSDPLERILSEQVVLDTATPIIYIGKLAEITDQLFVLTDVDVHDCRDGHANKERYLAEAHGEGVPINRRQVVVMRSFIISVSRLADIVIEQQMGNGE